MFTSEEIAKQAEILARQTSFIDTDNAFEKAIDCGRLSSLPGASNYAGDFMYMGTQHGRDLFKHCDTRQYIA